MRNYEARLLYLPDGPALRFLPEGPHALADGRISWVAIQHGPQATTGSLNVLDLARGENQSFPLAGRPGFAFPTQRSGTFVVGLERRIVLLDPRTSSLETLCEGIDDGVADTIINDGLAFDEGLLFGTKDLRFQEAKAGLYLWRRADRRLIRLRDDQICSNGKVLTELDGQRCLLDIDTPTRHVHAGGLFVAETPFEQLGAARPQLWSL